MADNFALSMPGLTAPATRHRLVTPNDGVDLDPRPRAIVALTSGTIAMRDDAGTVITYPALAGQQFDFRAVRIMATGTTATVAAWE